MSLLDRVRRRSQLAGDTPGDAPVHAQVRPRTGIFYGWWIVGAGVALNAMGGWLHVYGFGAFFLPLIREFGWSRAALSGALSVARLEAGLLAPVVGFVVDRFGPRISMVIGFIITGVGFLLLSQIDSLVMFYVMYIGVVTIGRDFSSGLPIQTAVVNWFRRRRGLALALIVSGIGLGGSLVPITAWFISTFGWRSAMITTGVLTVAIGVPLTMVLRHRPEDYGYLPDGDLPEGAVADAVMERQKFAETPLEKLVAALLYLPGLLTSWIERLTGRFPWLRADAGAEVNFTPREAIWTVNFWLISLSFGLSALISGLVLVHYIPFLVNDLGLSDEAAAGILATHALASVGGRMLFGWMGDLIERKYVFALCLIGQVAGLVLFTVVGNGAALMVVVIGFALFYGGPITVRAAIIGDYFGRAHFGTISGLVRVADVWGTVGGPVFAGWVFDSTGSYTAAYLAIAFATALAAASTIPLRRPNATAIAR